MHLCSWLAILHPVTCPLLCMWLRAPSASAKRAGTVASRDRDRMWLPIAVEATLKLMDLIGMSVWDLETFWRLRIWCPALAFIQPTPATSGTPPCAARDCGMVLVMVSSFSISLASSGHHPAFP